MSIILHCSPAPLCRAIGEGAITTLYLGRPSRKLDRTLVVELAVVGAVFLIAFFASVQFDIFESVVVFDAAYPDLHSDDLVIALTAGSFALLWFGRRRWVAHARAVEQANRRLTEKRLALEAARQELEVEHELAVSASRAKSEFLTNMSHELRTPLIAIIGFSDLLMQRNEAVPGSAHERYLAEIQRSGRHLLRLIDDVLDTSRLRSGHMALSPCAIDLADLTRACVDLVAPLAEQSGLTLTVLVPDHLAVMADPGKVKQILVNLLSNAVKFTPRGGQVEIRLEPAETPPDTVLITVGDTGIGMAPAEIARALEPFQQVDGSLTRRHEGMGLGLPLARRIAELHGGRLVIDSTPGGGTVARVRLPILVGAGVA
ncbi:MAG: HAMP domain-containing sensor histidine kinase [Aliidongia sp.]